MSKFHKDLSKDFSEGTLNVFVDDDQGHTKRPLNAYMIFSIEERQKLQEMMPGTRNTELSKMIGMKWNSLSAAEKKPYKKEAERLQQEHKKNHPDYRYAPNRKERKKSRKSHILPGDQGSSPEPSTSCAGCPTANPTASSMSTQAKANWASDPQERDEPLEYISTDFEELLTPLPPLTWMDDICKNFTGMETSFDPKFSGKRHYHTNK